MESKKAKEIMEKAAGIIEKQASEIETLTKSNQELSSKLAGAEAKIAEHDRWMECEKIASIMIDKGLIGYSDFTSETKKMYDSKDDVQMLKKVAEKISPKEDLEFYGGITKMSADEIAEQQFKGNR